MLSSFLGGQQGPGTTQVKPGLSEPSIVEVIPSPESEKANPIETTQAPQQVAVLSSTLTPSKRSSRPLAFFDQVENGIRAYFGVNDYVAEQHVIIQKKCTHTLGAGVSGRIFDTTHAGLLEWIRAERLTRLPHKGSSWDRVLISAHHFADQVELLHQSVEAFTSRSGAASRLVYGQCLLLLELGQENSLALEKALGVFYELGLELRPLLRRADLFDTSKAVQDHLGRAYVDLMEIVTSVAVHFHQLVHGLKTANATVSVDVHTTFGDQIQTFRSRLRQCAQEMWTCSFQRKKISHGNDVNAIQRWLAPKDSVLAFLASNHINMAVKPEQFTCTWFQPHLNNFIRSKNNILLVEGKVGSGKTVLANWTLDRLQRSICRMQVSTFNFSFNPSIDAQATTAAMLKTLLYQLMGTIIGNIEVYKAVREVYHVFEARSIADDNEELLWKALDKALEAVSEEHDELLVIVLDGLDEIQGGKPAAERTSQKLHTIAQRLGAVRVVQFSQKLDLKQSEHTMRMIITKDQILDDIRTAVQAAVSNHAHFKDRDLAEQDEVLDQLSDAADGSFLWASLASEVLRFQKTHEDFNAAFQALKSDSKAVSGVVLKLLSLMKLDESSKLILSWLFAAERPLTLNEVEILLRIKPGQNSFSEQQSSVEAALLAIAPFTIVSEGLVAPRHSAIEQAILSIPNSHKQSLRLTERHRDFMVRLLAYAKACSMEKRQPTFDVLDLALADKKFDSHRLLEYTVRYWAVHFEKSTLFKATGALQLTPEVKSSFPRSVILALMERACWDEQFSTLEALNLQHLAYRVRIACFGDEHACVLQSAIIYASLLEANGRHTEAVTCFHGTMQMSEKLLGSQAAMTYILCETVVRISESLVTRSRTDIMTYREETYKLMVKIYTHRYGTSSKEVLEIYQLLHKLYIFISEEHNASEISIIIRKITIIVHGQGSEQEREISRHLDVVLRKHKEVETVDTFGWLLFGAVEGASEETLTIAHIEIIIRLAGECILRKEFSQAEEMYIALWLKLTHHCHGVSSVEWHEKKIQVMLIYVSFLQERKRVSEASSILVCIWREYEHREFFQFESIIVLFKEVAVLMKAFGLFAFALSIFHKCRSWYLSVEKKHLAIFKEIETHITETSVEIVKTTTKSTTVSTTSVTVIREVFESSFTSTEVSTTTIELCRSLVSIYMKKEHWSEALICIEKTLRASWAAFFCETIDMVKLTESFTSESIELVAELAICYISMSRFDRAEYLYLRLWKAIRASCKVDSNLFAEYREIIVAFYSSHGYYHKLISFHQDLLVCYRAFYGASHAITIATLYKLGEMCLKYQRTHGYWIEYYLEILTVLNKGAVICHEDALRALIVVAKYYYEDCRYSESLQYFKSILDTFVKFEKTYKFFEKVVEVQEIFEFYFRALEESRTEISVQISILKEYRQACVHVFGATASITIHATFQLAEICTRSEHFQFEAIAFYEHVCKYSSSTEIITKTKSTLKTLYIKQVTSTTTTVTKEVLQRTTKICYEKYIEIRKSHSCTHELTLSVLRELVMLYFKRSMLEKSIKELQTILIECVTQVTSAKELVDTATYLAEIFNFCGYTKHAWEIINEIKLQVIYKSTKNISSCGFNVISTGRECFAFVAAFECYLRVDLSMTIADYMSALVAECLYFERFCSRIKSKSTFEVIIVEATRLRKVLCKNDRLDCFVSVKKETIEYFLKTELSVVKASTRAEVEVFVSLLLEYFTEHRIDKKFIAYSGYAALVRIRSLIVQSKHQEAIDLTRCTYKFLMAHEGLDDPTEISLGFQLCLIMADRGEHLAKDKATHDAMLELSGQILGEVFDICKASKIDLTKCQLSELDELVSVVGEQRDYKRLEVCFPLPNFHNIWLTHCSGFLHPSGHHAKDSPSGRPPRFSTSASVLCKQDSQQAHAQVPFALLRTSSTMSAACMVYAMNRRGSSPSCSAQYMSPMACTTSRMTRPRPRHSSERRLCFTRMLSRHS
jgi:tetratricopeptide (TPR) repeat protein